MSPIDLFAWIVILVLAATLIAIVIAPGMMPGRIARRRNHPWAEAIAVGSWPRRCSFQEAKTRDNAGSGTFYRRPYWT